MAAGGPYITLELPFDGIRDIPTVPISLMEEAFLVAAPRESVPWRPSSLVAVGDAVTQAPSADGQTVAASLLVLSPQSAHAMVQSHGHRGWVPDGRWPAHGAFLGVQGLPIRIAPEDIDIDEATAGPPPTEMAVSPLELDHATGGGLTNGLWFGLVALPYPTPEPVGEPAPGLAYAGSGAEAQPEESPGLAGDDGAGMSAYMSLPEDGYDDAADLSSSEDAAAIEALCAYSALHQAPQLPIAEVARRAELLRPHGLPPPLPVASKGPGVGWAPPPLRPPPPAGAAPAAKEKTKAKAPRKSSPPGAGPSGAVADLAAQVHVLAEGQARLQQMLFAQLPNPSLPDASSYGRVPLGIGAVGAAGSSVFAGAPPPPGLPGAGGYGLPAGYAQPAAWQVAQRELAGGRGRMQEGGHVAWAAQPQPSPAGGGAWGGHPGAGRFDGQAAVVAQHREGSDGDERERRALAGAITPGFPVPPMELTLQRMADAHAIMARVMQDRTDNELLGLGGGESASRAAAAARA